MTKLDEIREALRQATPGEGDGFGGCTRQAEVHVQLSSYRWLSALLAVVEAADALDAHTEADVLTARYRKARAALEDA